MKIVILAAAAFVAATYSAPAQTQAPEPAQGEGETSSVVARVGADAGVQWVRNFSGGCLGEWIDDVFVCLEDVDE